MATPSANARRAVEDYLSAYRAYDAVAGRVGPLVKAVGNAEWMLRGWARFASERDVAQAVSRRRR